MSAPGAREAFDSIKDILNNSVLPLSPRAVSAHVAVVDEFISRQEAQEPRPTPKPRPRKAKAKG